MTMSTQSKRKYDATVARIAGNIAPALVAYNMASSQAWTPLGVAQRAVEIARAIVAEVKRTEPNDGAQP